MTDPEQTRQESPVEPPQTLGSVEPRHAVGGHDVGAGGIARGGQHARLDDPDRIRQDGGGDAGEAGREEVVGGRQGVGRAVGGLDEVFDVAVAHEVEAPAHAVAEHVGHEAAVEIADDGAGIVLASSLAGDLFEDAEAVAGAGGGFLGDLEAGLDDVEGVDDKG